LCGINGLKCSKLELIVEVREDMVWDKWWGYFERVVQTERDDWGVYELADEAKNTVYYGSGMVRTRLLDHLNKKECPLARHYRVEMLGDEAQCRAKEEELLRQYKMVHGELPIYNEKIG
jgi:predicted GIY-YIG superfamily endonuclease